MPYHSACWDSLQWHHNERASQITSLTIVQSTDNSGGDQRKHQKLRVTGLCAGNSPMTGEFPAQRASNAENVSIFEFEFDIVTSANQYYTRWWHVPWGYRQLAEKYGLSIQCQNADGERTRRLGSNRGPFSISVFELPKTETAKI